MKTGKKLLSLILVLALSLSLAITSSAEEEIIADVYDLDNNLIESVTSVDALVNMLASDYEDKVFILKSDITVPIKEANSTAYAILDLNIAGLDLNWHTIKVTGNVSTEAQLIYLIPVSQTSQIEFIKNGSIVFDCTLPESAPNVAGMYLLRQGPLVLENLELIADESSNLKIGILGGGIEQVDDHFLKNCVVDVGGQAVGTQNTGEWTMKLESGSYTNMPSDENSNIIISGSPHTDINGVDEGTTVITSDDTTAIIVDDGNAYLYDTLQDAVNDAAKRTDTESVTIHLLKQPESTEVKLPSETPDNITLSKLGTEDISFSEVNITDAAGSKVTVGNDGKLIFTVPVTSVTLDKTSLDLTVGDSAALSATVYPENATNKDVTWSSSDETVAKVDSTGKVTALKPGTTTITAKADGKTAECTVTVSREPVIPDPNGITVTQPANGTIRVNPSNGSAGTLITVTATPDKGYELAYITVDGERITGNTFRMPDKAVTVSAVFVPVTFPFVDVKTGDWFYDYVAYVYSNGLMDGTSATTFEPNANMTRAMVWTILARIDGETVTGANWIDTARAWAMAEGVSDGTDPNGLVTREQFATMLYRYAVAQGYDVSIGESTNILSYADYDEISEWAIPAMQWACGSGVITGVTESTLAPQGTATRAQCAAMLMRFVEL